MKISMRNVVKVLSIVLFISLASACYKKSSGHDRSVERHTKIHLALAKHIHSRDIDVHMNNDMLQVAGFVDNNIQYKKVEEVLREFRQTKKVYNNVRVLSVHDDSNDETHLKKAVLRKLDRNGYPDKGVSVQVRNGNVILSGFVNRHINLEEVAPLLSAVPGIKKVNNYLLYKQAVKPA